METAQDRTEEMFKTLATTNIGPYENGMYCRGIAVLYSPDTVDFQTHCKKHLQKENNMENKMVNSFKAFTGMNWVELLKVHPSLAAKCDEYGGFEKIGPDGWVELLMVQPDFDTICDKYDGWKNIHDWGRLLSAQSRFADRCEVYNGWAKISIPRWVELLIQQPQLIRRCEAHQSL